MFYIGKGVYKYVYHTYLWWMRNHHQKVIVYLLIEIGNNIQNKLIIFYKINTKMINFVFSTINKTLETRLVFWNFLLNHWMLLLKLHTRISFHRTEVAKIASSIPDGQFGHNIRTTYLQTTKELKCYFFLSWICISNSNDFNFKFRRIVFSQQLYVKYE